METLLTAENLTKHYKDVVALDGVSFGISDGITGILGENGAGKSTAIKIFLGLLRPTSGSVKLGGTGARIEGFTVTGGGRSGVFAHGEVTITNNVIQGNTSGLGGGIYLLTASCYYETSVDAVISNNTVENNRAIAPDPLLRASRPAPNRPGRTRFRKYSSRPSAPTTIRSFPACL